MRLPKGSNDVFDEVAYQKDVQHCVTNKKMNIMYGSFWKNLKIYDYCSSTKLPR